MKALFQFMILRDGESFEYHAFEMHEHLEDGSVAKAPAGTGLPKGGLLVLKPDDALRRIYEDESLFH